MKRTDILRILTATAISVLLLYLVFYIPDFTRLTGDSPSLGDALFGQPRIEFREISEILARSAWGYMVLAAAMVLFSFVLRSWRWQWIVRAVAPVRFRTMFFGMGVGYLLNNLLPLKTGDLVRSMLVARRATVSVGSVLTSVVIERILDIFSMQVIFLYILLTHPALEWVGTALLVSVAVVVVFVAVGLLILSGRKSLLDSLRDRFGGNRLLVYISNHLGHLVEGLTLLRRPKLLAISAAISVAVIYADVFTLYLVYTGIDLFSHTVTGQPVNELLVSSVGTIAGMIGFAIPSTGGLGSYHGSVSYALSMMNIQEATAITAALVGHLVSYLTITAYGLLSMLVLRIRLQDLKIHSRV